MDNMTSIMTIVRGIQLSSFLIVSLAFSACDGPSAPSTRPAFPPTRTVDIVNDFHGTKVKNPYQWLEDLESGEVREWAAAQTAFGLPFYRETAVGAWLQNRQGQLAEFFKRPPSDDERAPEKPLVDESMLKEGEEITDVFAAPDRKHAAYTMSVGSSDPTEVRIRRVADGVEERIEGLIGPELSWTRDSRGFFYVLTQKPDAGANSKVGRAAVYYHAIGNPQTEDRVIYEMGSDPAEVQLEQYLSRDGRFLIIAEGNGAWVDGLSEINTRLQVMDLVDPSKPVIDGSLVPLSAERDAAYRVIATEGDTLYLFTDRGAPRRRIAAVTLADPSVENWRDVVPQTDDVIHRVDQIGGRFVVTYLRNVQHGVRVYERSGQLVRELPFRPMTVIRSISEGAPGELVVDATEGLSLTRRRYDYTTGRETVERGPEEPSPADAFEVRQVWYAAKDGVQVPMFLAHRRGLVPDGTHPVILSGYGGSADVAQPNFGPVALAMLETGFVLAGPSIRGGGEFGREWYEAAILERKQTTFDDFIAAAEYLIREKYTSPERLAIQGSSNGGWLVTAVLTQRPELFRVAVAGAPATDLLRLDGGSKVTQVGTAKNPEHIPFLFANSPAYGVKQSRCYPATLITAAIDDEVLPAWQSFKMVAALQAAQSCDRPVLLRADTEGGHSGNRTYGYTDMVGFIANQLGVKQPTGSNQTTDPLRPLRKAP